MSRIERLTRYCLFGFTVLAIISFSSSSIRAKRSELSVAGDAQTVQALLDEVHELRLALQQSTLGTYRTQLMLERARLQQDRVDTLRQELDHVREENTTANINRPRMLERLKEMEHKIEEEKDAARSAQLESEYKELKSLIDEQGPQDELRKEKEIRLASQLQIEQAKLAELNERLDAIERDLAAQLNGAQTDQNKR